MMAGVILIQNNNFTMTIELDHVFILVEPEAKDADALVELGVMEGSSNDHKGQGTSNRRFYFENGMLEFLYVRNEQEANEGPARNLRFPERSKNSQASPFGVILHAGDESKKIEPFEGWKYQPDYFKDGWAFHVGSNSEIVCEPLCIYVPFYNSEFKPKSPNTGIFKTMNNVKIFTPTISKTLALAGSAKRLSIELGNEHLMEISFNRLKRR